MAYQSRRRQYKSRRERYEQNSRNLKVFFIFGVLGLAVYLFKIRYEFWAWLKTYFY
jgi:hypothetical protein